METGHESTDNLYAFLEAEGYSYRGALSELSDMIARYIRDGEGDSLPRALELTRSLERLLNIQ